MGFPFTRPRFTSLSPNSHTNLEFASHLAVISLVHLSPLLCSLNPASVALTHHFLCATSGGTRDEYWGEAQDLETVDKELPSTLQSWMTCAVGIGAMLGILFYVSLATHAGYGAGLLALLAALAGLYYLVLVLSQRPGEG